MSKDRWFVKQLSDSDFADPTARIFPIFDAAHVRMSMRLILVHDGEFETGKFYDGESFRAICLRIVRSAKKFGVNLPKKFKALYSEPAEKIIFS